MKTINYSPSLTPGKENILQEGHCVRNRWHIIKKIGQGAFGEVYHCRDKKDDTEVAIKIVSKEKDSNNSNAAIQILKLEVSILRAIQAFQGQGFFPRFKAYGKTMRFDYLAMELLGPSLSELRRSQPRRKFSLSTTLRLGERMLRCIQAIHRAGYVHRDVKPSNFVMGIGKNSRKVYLLDFGLSRQYLLENGELRPARPKASFQGTPRYASINVLNHREAGRQDDLISLFYVLSEFTFQELPWKNFRELTDVAYAKETFDHQLLVSEFPDEFHDYFHHISDLRYEDEPDYEMLLSLFERTLTRRGVRESDPLDFETDEVTPFVNLQEHPQSARTQSDVHVVKSELDNPVMAEERLDNMNHQITSSNQVGGSCVLEENSEKKISKNVTNISINSNNVYSSCKDTGFSISPNGNPTFASVNTDVESPVSNDPKNKLLCQPIKDLKKAISSPHNDSMDSLLKESATLGRNTTDNSQLTLKPFPQLAPQVIKRINLAIPLQCSKNNKPEKKEKRRHSVRRSVSQPARTRASLNVVSHHALLSVPSGLLNPSRGSERGLLPRCWSCPTISLFIRSDLRPPLKQQASFEENIYEVDVMRNVAAARKVAEDIVQSGTARRNSLPSVLDLKTPIGHFASEQELTRRDADIYDGSLENNRDAYYMREKRNPASAGLTKVKKSLSDSNVVGYKKSKHLRTTRPLTPVDSSKLTQLLPDGHRSETPEINAPVSSNYSLSKSPTFKNYAENCKISQESQKCSNEQEAYTTTNNSAFSENPKGLANHVNDDLKNNARESDKNPPVEVQVTSLESDSLSPTKHKEADIRRQIKDPSPILENSKGNQMPTNINAGLEIKEPPLQKENGRVVNNIIVTKNISSKPVGEFLNSTTENARRNSEDTAVNVSQSKENILKTSTKPSDTHTQVQSNEQETSGSRNKSSHQSETGFKTENVHRLEKQKSQLNIPKVVINNGSEMSLSGSSNHLSKSFQGNKVQSEENHASPKLSHSEEINHVQLSEEQNSPTSAISTKTPLQGTSNHQAVHDSGKIISERNLSGIENDILDLSEKKNSLTITPEVVIKNDAEGRPAESFQQKNEIDFSENGSSQKKSCAKVDLSSLQCEEIVSRQAVPSFNNCMNTVDTCSFPNSKDPTLEEHKKFDVPKTNGLQSERVVSEPENKSATTLSNDMIERSGNIPSESKSLAKQNIAVDSNKCNEIFDSFKKDTDTDTLNNDTSCEILTKPSRSVSILSENVQNSKNSQFSENKQSNASETEINNFVCESNGSYSHQPPISLSGSSNISQKNHHVPTKDVSNSLHSNVSKETGKFFQNNSNYQLSDQEHENSTLKNPPKIADSGLSEKQEFNQPISNTLPCDSNENFSNNIVKQNASEQISNTLISDSNTKLCKSKSVSSIELKRNISPSTATSPKEKAASRSRDCTQKDHLFAKTDSNLADMVEPDVKKMAVNECVSPYINESPELLQRNSSDEILPKNNASKAELCISKSDPKCTVEPIEDTTPRNSRRQRQNSDSKYAKDEKDLNLNFTRRRHRPVSQIYEDAEEFSSFPSSSIVQSPSDNSVCDLLQPPPGDPPPNHCLPSRRMRYRSLTSSTSSS